jgi:hypothetical protein
LRTATFSFGTQESMTSGLIKQNDRNSTRHEHDPNHDAQEKNRDISKAASCGNSMR